MASSPVISMGHMSMMTPDAPSCVNSRNLPTDFEAPADALVHMGRKRRLAVPEPSTWAMMLLGFAGLDYAGVRRSSRGGISPVA